MNAKLIALVAIPTVTVSLLGGKAVWSHLSTLREQVKTSVRDATPPEYEIKRIKTLIADMSEDVLAFRDKIGEIEGTAAAQTADVKQLEERLAADRTDLLAERNLLSQDREVFQIRGTAYSRAQVEASAQARMAQIQRDQTALETKKEAVKRLEGAVLEGQARLREAIAVRDSKIQELDLLTAELANAELQRDLQALAAPLRDSVLTRSQSELAESMKAFADRVRQAKRQVESIETTNTSGLIVHQAVSQPGLLEQIDQLLIPGGASQTADH